MSTERTDEQMAEDESAEARIHAILEEIMADIVSWHLAEALDEPAEVCEDWVDRVWDGARFALADPEDRLHAVIMLVEAHYRAADRAEQMLRLGASHGR